MRTPAWAIVLVVLLIVGLGVYGYFTAPLPFGLNALVRTPGGGGPVQTTAPAAAQRTAAGQPLGLGMVTVQVQSVQRSVDLTTGGRSGPAGAFTIVLLQVQNGGNEAVTPRTTDFKLVDERGRAYAVDVEATRAASQTTRRRSPFEATVPPGGRLDTELAFEVAPDATSLTLRVTLGYGDVELPR
jgi:hypothetical protein